MNEAEMIEKITETATLAKHNESQIEEIREEIAEIHKENKAIYDIATSVKLISQDVSHVKNSVAKMENSQAEMKRELSDVKNASLTKKAKFLDKTIGAIIGAIGMGVLGYVLSVACPAIFK